MPAFGQCPCSFESCRSCSDNRYTFGSVRAFYRILTLEADFRIYCTVKLCFAAGLDPDNLPESDPSKMDFGSGGNSDKKAWKDIWGCGQGIGAVKSRGPAGAYVAKMAAEYKAAKARICG